MRAPAPPAEPRAYYHFTKGYLLELKRDTAAALSDAQFVVAYRDVGNSSYGTAIVGDFAIPLGIADAAASSGETVPVIIHGISDHHSGLVPGVTYYAQPDGSLTATDTDTRVGVAITATELLLDIER